MAEINTGVTLSLKDLFSTAMNKAAGAASGFSEKTLGAIEKVDKMASGTAAKLAALGISLSVGAATKGIIEMDHRMTRLGISAGMSADEVSKLKRTIFDTAQAADIKIDANNLLNSIDVIVNKTNDLQYAEENIRNVALAIQATGESGETIGDIFSEFQKFGYTTEHITSLMDDLSAQANIGSYSLADFARQAPAIFSSYSRLGTVPENIKKANIALQILNAGMKSPEKAANALYSTMNELFDNPEMRRNLLRMGIDIRDKATKEFKDFNDIMLEIASRTDDKRNIDYLNRIFSNSSMQAIRSYVSHGERMYENLNDLGDTTGLLQKQSAVMADTLQSNVKNLQTAFNSFADSNLTKPLSNITELLNKLSEDPERIKKIFTGIAVGIGAITAVKGVAGITRFISGLLKLKGGNINLGSLSMATAMPVYVTNWSGGGIPAGGIGGAGKSAPVPSQQTQLGKGTPLTNAQNAIKNLKPAQYAGAGVTMGIGAAFIKLPQMINELNQIKQNEELTSKERGKVKGGAIGDATGSIVGGVAGGVGGMAAGAAVGAAIGSVVPVLGTAVGALVGAGVGALGMWLGGKAGRKIGEGIGGAVADNKEQHTRSQSRHRNRSGMPVSDLPPQITQSGSNIAPLTAELEGHAVMDVNINLSGSRPEVAVTMQNNTIPIHVNTGSAMKVRNNL